MRRLEKRKRKRKERWNRERKLKRKNLKRNKKLSREKLNGKKKLCFDRQEVAGGKVVLRKIDCSLQRSPMSALYA